MAWIEISEANLMHNLKTVRQIIGNEVILAPCVKANAYGHGLVLCARIMAQNGVYWFCVDTVDEALFLKKNNVYGIVLIMGWVTPEEFDNVILNSFRIFLYDKNLAQAISQRAVALKKDIRIHIKIDTGMNRQGVKLEELEDFIKYIKSLPNIIIEGLATHYANADVLKDRKFYFTQKERFEKAIKISKGLINNKFLIHCANSSALLSDQSSNHDLVRPGLSIYGYYPSADIRELCQKNNISLRPVLSFYTKIIQLKNLKPGETVSYGCTFEADKDMVIALLPVGYYDGIGRILSNKGHVLIDGHRAKIIGRVCMNMMMVDVTEIDNLSVGSTVAIIGRQNDQAITADEIAELSDTIIYEILTRLRESIRRAVV